MFLGYIENASPPFHWAIGRFNGGMFSYVLLALGPRTCSPWVTIQGRGAHIRKMCGVKPTYGKVCGQALINKSGQNRVLFPRAPLLVGPTRSPSTSVWWVGVTLFGVAKRRTTKLAGYVCWGKWQFLMLTICSNTLSFFNFLKSQTLKITSWPDEKS